MIPASANFWAGSGFERKRDGRRKVSEPLAETGIMATTKNRKGRPWLFSYISFHDISLTQD